MEGLTVLTFSELQPLSSKPLLQGSDELLFDFFPLRRTRATLLVCVQIPLAYLTLPSVRRLSQAAKRHAQTPWRVVDVKAAAEVGGWRKRHGCGRLPISRYGSSTLLL